MRWWEVCGTYEPPPEMQEIMRKYETAFVALPQDHRKPTLNGHLGEWPVEEPKEADNEPGWFR